MYGKREVVEVSGASAIDLIRPPVSLETLDLHQLLHRRFAK
ncbi:hypothetical protein [Paraburkholderia guartelaensis]|nr:hypothetical protein [Paraburkholderia guartelaensis]